MARNGGERTGAEPAWRAPGLPAVVAVAVAGLLVVFFLPLAIPMRATLSDAYLVGYNSRAGFLLFLLLAAGLAVWTRGYGFRFGDVGSGTDAPVRIARSTFLWTLLGCAALVVPVWWSVHLVSPFYEAQYFADRYAMYGSGARLYTGFEFPYGPILFYLPLWVHWATGLTLVNSYFLAVLGQWVLGIWVLRRTVELAATDARAARAVYLLLWGALVFSALSGGPNYTPLRFSSTPLAALLVQRLFARGSAARGSALPACGLAAGSFVLLLLYSPEQGLLFLVATLVFLLMNWSPRRPGYFPGLALLLGVSVLALAGVNRLGELETFKAFGGGSLSFPLVLSVANLVLLPLLLVAGCGLYEALRSGRANGRWAHPLVYLCLIAGAGAPAGFSRADQGHILINTLGAILIALLLLYPRRLAWTVAKYAWVVVLVGLGGLGYVRTMRLQLIAAAQRDVIGRGTVGRALMAGNRLLHLRVSGATWAEVDRTWTVEMKVPEQLTPGETGPLLAPFGIHRRGFSDGPATAVSGRYNGLLPLISTVQPLEKIAELQKAPDHPVLVPSVGPVCDNAEHEREVMRRTLGALYLPPTRHTLEAAGQPLCTFLQQRYQPTVHGDGFANMAVWQPKP